MYDIAELKPGRAIVVDGNPFLVLWNQWNRRSQQRGVMATKLKNLRTGQVVQRTFQGSEKLEEADVGYRHVQFLYSSHGEYIFMDLETYGQFPLTGEMVGDYRHFLLEGMELDVLIFEEKPIGLRLPSTVDLKIIETTPGVRGDTATGGTKLAKLETGHTVSIPLFLEEEDTVRVNTETGEYVERASR